jgi:hypothetical protein
MKRSYFLAALFIVVGYIFIGNVQACSIEIQPLRKQFRRAKLVFIGKVLSIQPTPLTEAGKAGIPKTWRDWNEFSNIKFQVLRKWKGDSPSEREYVGIAYYICGCPHFPMDQFYVGKDYLIFAGDKKFITVCESEKLGSDYVAKEMKSLDSFWFRSWAAIYPF